MTKRRSSRTAEELMDELSRDPEFVKSQRAREGRRKQDSEARQIVLEPLLQELRAGGFLVDSLDELRRSGVPYEGAVSILVSWLPRIETPDGKESVVRSLTVPWAAPVAAKPLVQEFRKASPDQFELKWAIGNALAVVADDESFEEVASLVENSRHGRSREMLAVALGKMKNPKAVEILVRLLEDEEVAGHAIIGLGRIRARSALRKIQRFLNHPKAWVRQEAKHAIARIQKRSKAQENKPPTGGRADLPAARRSGKSIDDLG
jgi:HEAT repeat protein